jgi:hypothetical protein
MLNVLKVRQILYSRKPPSPDCLGATDNLNVEDSLAIEGDSDLEDSSSLEIDPTLVELTQEYYRLSKIECPTEADLEKLTTILDLAQYDTDLSSFINEADHLIALELGLAKDNRKWTLSLPMHAIAEQTIAPNRPGRVRYQGSYWFAQLYQPCNQTIISSGQTVNIVGIEGDNFLVTPLGLTC